MIAVVMLAASAALFVAGFMSGRYAGMFGVAAPGVVILILGVAWEWDPDALPLIALAGGLAGLGFVFGVLKRRSL